MQVARLLGRRYSVIYRLVADNLVTVTKDGGDNLVWPPEAVQEARRIFAERDAKKRAQQASSPGRATNAR
jgi:hypothetical protein